MARKNRKGHRRKHFGVLLLICGVLVIYGFFFTEKIIEPTMASIGEIRAKAIMVQAVNDAVRDKYEAGDGFDNLLDIKTDESGKVSLIQANSANMNKLSYDLAWDIQNRLRNIEEEKVQIPIGSIMGNQILSQTGPWVRLKILPFGATKIDFKTEFTEAGINQTKYKVHLEVTNTAKVVMPFSDNQIEVETILLLAEAVILGEIPDSFIYVPREDVLDAINP